MKLSTMFILLGLWFICYASQSFKCSWFSVFFGLMNVFPLVFKLFNQNLIKPYFTLFWFFEIVLACSSVVWEQFLAQTRWSLFNLVVSKQSNNSSPSSILWSCSASNVELSRRINNWCSPFWVNLDLNFQNLCPPSSLGY